MGSITNGLVAWYPLDGNATDMSTNSNDGTTYGASPTTDQHGLPNRALLFDGNDDYIQAAYSSAISNPNFSYSLSILGISVSMIDGVVPILISSESSGINFSAVLLKFSS